MTAEVWDEDVNTVLLTHYGIVPPSPKMFVATSSRVRELLVDAWQFGYTVGMKDAAVFEERLATLDSALSVLQEEIVDSESVN